MSEMSSGRTREGAGRNGGLMRLGTALGVLMIAAFLVGCEGDIQAGPSKSDYAESRKKQATVTPLE